MTITADDIRAVLTRYGTKPDIKVKVPHGIFTMPGPRTDVEMDVKLVMTVGPMSVVYRDDPEAFLKFLYIEKGRYVGACPEPEAAADMLNAILGKGL